MIAAFHFLRPWWLAAFPIGVWLLWQLYRRTGHVGSWQQVIDAPLQRYVLLGAEQAATQRRRPLALAVLAWLLASLALAGPTWERVPVPALRSQEALVVALDLSRSMDAADVAPSRLGRAKLKLLALLERRRNGQTGLVVFSAHAFTVSPLTNDTHTIAALVGALDSEIMPSRGSYPEAGLTRAAQLIEQSGTNRGEILLMTDAAVSARALAKARELDDQGIRVHVLALGTEEGAPIGEPNGGFLTDASGAVVVARLDSAGLRELARAGGGRFALATPDQRDLETLFPSAQKAGPLANDSAGGDDRFQTDIWRDEGRWLVLALLPLVAFSFRRGWVVCWLLALMLPTGQAQAFGWSDLWQRRDQQAAAALDAGEAERAAALFSDPQWRAAAQYRAGDYPTSAATLEGADNAEANYNRGNALAKAGQLDAAIKAYDRALALDPDHEDARYNRDLLKQAQQQSSSNAAQGSESQQQPGQQQQRGQQQQGQQQSTQSDGADQQRGAGRGEQSRKDDETATEQAQRDAKGDAEQQRSEEQAARAEQDQAQQANGAREQAAPQPSDQRDLEQWASEQAADQWLRRIPQDPGGLLRRKFLYQYQRLGVDQDGNYVWPGDEAQPW
jgi:Ca-activated chloride channel family protein